MSETFRGARTSDRVCGYNSKGLFTDKRLCVLVFLVYGVCPTLCYILLFGLNRLGRYTHWTALAVGEGVLPTYTCTANSIRSHLMSKRSNLTIEIHGKLFASSNNY